MVENHTSRDCAALIVAAGRGRRLGGSPPKQYQDLGGQPLLRRTLSAFAAHPDIASVTTVIHPDDQALYEQAAQGLGLSPPVFGGESRCESVRLGLESLAGNGPPRRVLIHDGARPFPDGGVIARVIKALDQAQGAVPALPLSDTIKRADALGRILGTEPRDGLWRAQTPQGFIFSDLLAAHRALNADLAQSVTDDAQVAEQAGLTVVLVEGRDENVKITTAADLDTARRRLAQPRRTRIAQGMDVHRFGPGTSIVLGGVSIPHDQALEGHSDADALLHALTDALLGLIAAGDIGCHFPPSDPQWKGADSARFVTHARRLVEALGGRLVNVDMTVVCERPRLAPYRPAMTERIAELLGLDQGLVSLKATTSEGLGFAGRREGIIAQAVVSADFPGL